MLLLSVWMSVAWAADGNGDGCEDAWFDANGACVASAASIVSGTTIGASATVEPYASIGSDVALGDNTFVASRASITGRVNAVGQRPIGARTTLGRRVLVGADHEIGADNTLARAVHTGSNLLTEGNVTVGYGSGIGDDVTLEAGATLGSLVTVGDHTTVVTGAVLARGVTIADSAAAASVGGIIGPDVTIGSGASIDPTARIRKDSILGDGVTVQASARLGRHVTLQDDTTIGQNVRIGANATVTATSVVPDNTVIGRGETYDNPVAVFVGSALLDASDMTQINTWIGLPEATWELCYSLAADGWSAAAFHDGCDNQGRTVTVVSANGKLFGGYTPLNWAGFGYTQEGSQSSFLFSLTNGHRHSLTSTSNHINRAENYLPLFGGGWDLGLPNFQEQSTCKRLGFTYSCRVGSVDTATCAEDFCGTYAYFTPDAVEVFMRQ